MFLDINRLIWNLYKLRMVVFYLSMTLVPIPKDSGDRGALVASAASLF